MIVRAAAVSPSRRVYLAPGRLFASAEDVRVTTILGSCVAVCLWDLDRGVGGVNHFLLPEGTPASPRFGDAAVSLLVESVLDQGACRSALRAKVVGGASLFEASAQAPTLGERNVAVARERLRAERISIAVEVVGGRLGRRLVFDLQTGAAWIRSLEPSP